MSDRKSGFSFNQCGTTKKMGTVKATGLFDVREEHKEMANTKMEAKMQSQKEETKGETRNVDKCESKHDGSIQRDRTEDNGKDDNADNTCEKRAQLSKLAISVSSKAKSPSDKNEKPSFLSAMMENAAKRKMEQEEAQIRMKRRRDDVSGEVGFVTNAYKKKLEDMALRHKSILEDDSDRDQLQAARFYSNIGAYDRSDSKVARERSPDRRQ